jgi:hypothetical protein
MPPREKFSFRNHLKDCKDCTKFLDSYAKAIYITGALQCYDLPLELQAKIKTFLNKIHKK